MMSSTKQYVRQWGVGNRCFMWSQQLSLYHDSEASLINKNHRERTACLRQYLNPGQPIVTVLVTSANQCMASAGMITKVWENHKRYILGHLQVYSYTLTHNILSQRNFQQGIQYPFTPTTWFLTKTVLLQSSMLTF